jgi:hypothetical protein
MEHVEAMGMMAWWETFLETRWCTGRRNAHNAPMVTDEHGRLGAWAQAAQFTRHEQQRRQQAVLAETLRQSQALDGVNFSSIHVSDLRRMALLVDEHFFEGRLLPLAAKEGLAFTLSRRMTKVAGMTTMLTSRQNGQRRFKIGLSTTLLFQTFLDVQREVLVAGVNCHSRLEAMQRVVEHELVHLLELLVWNDSACCRGRFQSIARGMFGHTEYRHELTTQTERAARRFGLFVGSHVRFTFEGMEHQGVVNRITRRATVLVADPRGEPYSDGRRYRRYYVPLDQLQPVHPSPSRNQPAQLRNSS